MPWYSLIMKHIKMSGGYLSLVDDEDYYDLIKFRWTYQKAIKGRSKVVYAKRFIRKGEYEFMHRRIMKAEKGRCVDHIDGNGLNNCRSNLRMCSQKENSANTRKHKSSSSRFKGVHFYARYRSWMAYICPNRRKIHLGYFKTEEEAAQAYNKAALLYFGEFARLNEV